MDYETAKEKIMSVFYGLPQKEQVHHVELSFKGKYDVEIFPMSAFQSFCDSHFGGDIATVAMVMQRSRDKGLYWDKADDWFMWNKTNETIDSAADAPTDFVLYEDDLYKTLVNPRDLTWLGFSADDIREILEAAEKERFCDGQEYNVIVGDETGKLREVYRPQAVTLNREIHYDGDWLMENAFLGSLLAYGISLKLLGTYKRVIWLGQYANGMEMDHENTSKLSKENSPYYLAVKKNVPVDVEIPDYDEPWKKGKDETVEIELASYDLHHFPMKWDSYLLVNKEKKEFLDVGKYIKRSLYQSGINMVVINPMVLLTAFSCASLMGDYYGTDMEFVGSWAWNLIGFEKSVRKGYKEISPTFIEKERK